MTQVTVSRPRLWRDCLSTFRIYVDGKRKCLLWNGQTKSFTVEPGEHQMACIVAQNLTSRKIDFSADGKGLTFEAIPKSTVPTGRLRYIRDHDYVLLRQLDESGSGSESSTP